MLWEKTAILLFMMLNRIKILQNKLMIYCNLLPEAGDFEGTERGD
jgi:hypothetical protein